jgi:Pectate lyase superfamily protein/Right handed beta helix region
MDKDVFYNRDKMYENIPNAQKKLIADVEEIKTNGLPDEQARRDISSLSETVGDQSSKIDVLSRKTDRKISVLEYGIKGDGSTNDTTKLNEMITALPEGTHIKFPYGVYKTTGFINLKSNMVLEGDNATILGSGFQMVDKNNITIKGFSFVKDNSSIGIWAQRCSDITIKDNKFDTVRLYAFNDKNLDNCHRLRIESNKFIGDFVDSTYLNVVETHGINQTIIANNFFECYNVTRFMKLTAGSSVIVDGLEQIDNYNRNMVVAGNVVTGSRKLYGGEIKQVIDFFAGCGEIVVSNNVFNLANETVGGTVLEGKNSGGDDGTSRVTNRQKNIIVTDNVIVAGSDAYSIMYQGAWGVPWESEEEQRVTITNNIIYNTSTNGTVQEGVRVRGMHSATISNNQIYLQSSGTGIKGISADNNKDTIIEGNLIPRGSILVSMASNNTTGLTFSKPSENVIIKSNILRQWRNFGGIQIQSQGVLSALIIEGNILKTNNTVSPQSWAIFLSSLNISYASITGNFSEASDNSARNSIRYDNGATVVKLNEHGNSWNKRRIESSTLPTIGKWVKGDTITNTSPVSGGYIGWICVTSGTLTPTTWTANTAYTVGTKVYAGEKVYEATVAGTSGTSAPTHTSGTNTDGTVTWQYIDPVAKFKGYGLIEA